MAEQETVTLTRAQVEELRAIIHNADSPLGNRLQDVSSRLYFALDGAGWTPAPNTRQGNARAAARGPMLDYDALLLAFTSKWSGNDKVEAGDVLEWIMCRPVLAVPAAAIDAREQVIPTTVLTEQDYEDLVNTHGWDGDWKEVVAETEAMVLSKIGGKPYWVPSELAAHEEASAIDAREQLAKALGLPTLKHRRYSWEYLLGAIEALASRSEAPVARPNEAGQEQGGASAGLVLIGWEYRHLDIANTPNRWSEWERCRARNRHTSTDEDFANEIRAYIKSGFNYEVRELYAATPPLEAVGSSGMTADQAQGDKA